MKLTIKNKNTINGVDQSFNIVNGAVVTDNKDETLDTVTVILSHLTNKIDIEPYDEVILTDDLMRDRFMAVNNYSVRQLSLYPPIYYEYTINLFSQTKLLEGFILPSLKITQVWDKNASRSIYDYLVQYLNEYGPKIRVGSSRVSSFEPKWIFSDRVRERFSQIECPEMQWNNPTLREVLNSLMMIDDCIVTLKDNIIDYIDLTSEGIEITTNNEYKNGINYVEENQSSDDYVSDLRLQMNNVLQTKVQDVDNTVTVCEYFGVRSTNYLLTSENMEIQTMNPILRIKHCYLCFTSNNEPVDGAPNERIYIEQDLMNCIDPDGKNYPVILESKEFQTRKIYTKTDLIGVLGDWKTMTSYQNFCLTYSRGGNTISGFSKLNDLFNLIKVSNNTISIIAYRCILAQTGLTGHLTDKVYIGEPWDIYFKIEYETTADSTMKVGRYLPRTNHKEVIDNQTNSYVDSWSQGALEYMKVNRLGNKMCVINARYVDKTEDQIPDLGDKFNENIIFKKQLSFKNNIITANYWATKNYIMRDYYTGVKAKIRSWKIADGSDALTRHDIEKFYFEFSYYQKDETDLLEISNSDIITKMMSPFVERASGNPLTHCLMRFNTMDDLYPKNVVLADGSHDTYYVMDFLTRLSGNSMVLTWGMNDNYNVQKYIDESLNNKLGGMGQAYYVYADTNGENIGGDAYFVNGLDIGKNGSFVTSPFDGSKCNDIVWPNSTDVVTVTTSNTMTAISRVLPRVIDNCVTGDFMLKIPFRHKKDNSEISRGSIQFEFCADEDTIIFGRKFLEKQEFVSLIGNNPRIFNYYLSSQKPNIANPEYLDKNVAVSTDISEYAPIKESNVSIKLPIRTVVRPNPGLRYLYITDENDNIIVAWDYFKHNILYLNMLKDRNTKVYSSRVAQRVVGDITFKN